MSVITIISDWNRNDYYLASVKAYIESNSPNAKVIDISHNIQCFNVLQAGFVLNSCFRHFPEGSIHLVAINSEKPRSNNCFAFKIDNHYFISSDNGIIGLLTERKPEIAICLHTDNSIILPFPEFSILTPAACKLANGEDIFSLGNDTIKPYRLMSILPTEDESVIIGRVIYFDSYHNAISNISKEFFEKVAKGREFQIFINSNTNKVSKINNYYSETSEGDIFCIFNSLNLLEIGIFAGNSMQLLGIDTSSTIRINFFNK